MPIAAKCSFYLFFLILGRDWRQNCSVEEVSSGPEESKSSEITFLCIFYMSNGYQSLSALETIRACSRQHASAIRRASWAAPSGSAAEPTPSPSTNSRLEGAKLAPLWQSAEEGIQIPPGALLCSSCYAASLEPSQVLWTQVEILCETAQHAAVNKTLGEPYNSP